MIARVNRGILYPENPVIDKTPDSNPTVLPHIQKVPCASYEICREKLDEIFRHIGNCNPEYIFVFGVLKQGKINFDDPFMIYTNEDCPFEDVYMVKNDEVCSEEFCAEILLPYCDVYFPTSKVYQFLANDISPLSDDFMNSLKKKYPESLFLISDCGLQNNHQVQPN